VDNLGQFIGSHAVLLFGTLALTMLWLTALAWWMVSRWGERWWSAGMQAWAALLQSEWIQRLLARFPALRKLRENRFVAGGYLGVHSVIGFLIVLVTLSIFAELADEIAEDEDFAHFDTELTLTLSQTLAPKTLQAFYWITQLGDVRTLVALGIAVTAFLLLRKRWLLAASWSLALAGNGLLVRLLKWIFQRDRPLHEHGLLIEQGWSFPSGHASGALVAYGMLAYLLVRATPRGWHLLIVCAAIALILLIGFSRVFLQVHYFSDVVAGYMSGMAWLVVCVGGCEVVLRQRARRPKNARSSRAFASGG
jgi:membrane-associated phospholipid phosphatase